MIAPLVGDVVDGRLAFSLRQVYEVMASRVIAVAGLLVSLSSMRVSIRHEVVVLVLWRILRTINYLNEAFYQRRP